MATSHQNHSQNKVVNGANGERDINGGDDLPQPQPSTSGEQEVEPVPSLQSLCFRALFLCCDLLQGLVQYISRELRLPDSQTLDIIYGHLNDADHSTSWATAAARREQEVEPVPSLQSLCNRALFFCCDLLQGLVLYISRELRLTYYQNLDVIYGHLNDADHSTAWAIAAARRPQPQKWYFFVPVRLFQMITSTGATLIERYLDKQVPENQDLVNWLRDIPAAFIGYEEEAYRLLGSNVDSEQPSSYTDVGPVPSSTSSGSSLIIDEEHESEEPAEPDPSDDRSKNFSVEQLKEQVEATESVIKDDKLEKKPEETEKLGEKMAERKAEDERPATEAVAAGGPSVSTDQPQPQPQPQAEPQPQPLSAAAAAECLVYAQEAEHAAIGAPRTPSAQPASSQHCLAAVGPSQPTPGSIRTACKPAKGARFLNLLGSKKA